MTRIAFSFSLGLVLVGIGFALGWQFKPRPQITDYATPEPACCRMEHEINTWGREGGAVLIYVHGHPWACWQGAPGYATCEALPEKEPRAVKICVCSTAESCMKCDVTTSTNLPPFMDGGPAGNLCRELDGGLVWECPRDPWEGLNPRH